MQRAFVACLMPGLYVLALSFGLFSISLRQIFNLYTPDSQVLFPPEDLVSSVVFFTTVPGHV
jgi:hypothetical protein